jgi:diketogulonate reductase-like aldo/keto reductase
MSVPLFTLSSGQNLPRLGLGTWESPPGVVAAAVKKAVELGYRHLDFAHLYGNQKEIGMGFLFFDVILFVYVALKEILESGKVKREELFITGKLSNFGHRPEIAAQEIRSTVFFFSSYNDNF